MEPRLYGSGLSVQTSFFKVQDLGFSPRKQGNYDTIKALWGQPCLVLLKVKRITFTILLPQGLGS